MPIGMRVCLRRRVVGRSPRNVWMTKSRLFDSSASNATVAPARTRMRGRAGRQAVTMPRMSTLLGRPSHAISTTTGVPGDSSVVVGQKTPAVGNVGQVVLFELLQVPAADTQNVHGGSGPGE